MLIGIPIRYSKWEKGEPRDSAWVDAGTFPGRPTENEINRPFYRKMIKIIEENGYRRFDVNRKVNDDRQMVKFCL
ncbi:hypothetical protein CUU66_17565 [Peribacillus deserti]|uniref:Uncharacterized protein n=1 Tax=Peribacillus deserti TaxID=673318 RepID=A0A2N5M2M7_9BACI|nr:hypothetical protein CUU66_17565 [Peribacillus deserti]